MDPLELKAVLEQLGDARSAKRQDAAKKLRKVGDPQALGALLVALEKEIRDRRTWETQYQMIMAVAACGKREASPLLERILLQPLEPMVHLAAGDALLRLSDDVDSAVLGALRSKSPPRIEGTIRALAMAQIIPAALTIEAVVGYASEPSHQHVRFWVAAAAAGWKAPPVRRFLEACRHDESAETRRAAQASLEGRYVKWKPL